MSTILSNEQYPLENGATIRFVAPAASPVGVLQHELFIHQTELEMQNEELRRAQIALEESRDRYVDFYEFAPIGYLTLTRAGMIAEVNLTCAALLGILIAREQNRMMHP